MAEFLVSYMINGEVRVSASNSDAAKAAVQDRLNQGLKLDDNENCMLHAKSLDAMTRISIFQPPLPTEDDA